MMMMIFLGMGDEALVVNSSFVDEDSMMGLYSGMNHKTPALNPTFVGHHTNLMTDLSSGNGHNTLVLNLSFVEFHMYLMMGSMVQETLALSFSFVDNHMNLLIALSVVGQKQRSCSRHLLKSFFPVSHILMSASSLDFHFWKPEVEKKEVIVVTGRRKIPTGKLDTCKVE